MKILRLAAGPVTFALLWMLMASAPAAQRAAAAIFALAVALWVTETLPLAITALLSTTLLVLFGVTPAETAFRAYSDPVILLFIGSFILAKALEVSGLDRRLSLLLLRHPWATATPWRVLLSFGLVATILSLFLSNTATAAMMLPIALSTLTIMGVHDRGAPYATGLLLMVTWGSSVAVGTIVGTPPNLIAISHLQHTVGMRIGFLEWMAFGIPITFTMLGVCWLVLRLLYGRSAPATSRIAPHAAQVFQRMGPMGAGERNALVAFLTAVTLWVLPGVAELLVGSEHPIAAVLTARLDPAVAALTGAILLFALPSRGDRSGVLTWKEAAAIDWGTILLFGGGIALGRAIFDSGLAESLGRALARASGAGTVWGITALVTAVAIAFSELASNTASAATTVPLAIGLAVGAGVSPIGPALGAGLGASFGFMLPISTPPNAIVYSSGLIPPGQMMRTGFIIDLAGFAVTLLWLFLILPAVGLL